MAFLKYISIKNKNTVMCRLMTGIVLRNALLGDFVIVQPS